MTQKLVYAFGIVMSALLIWNIRTIQALESRIATLEDEQAFTGDASGKKPTKQDNNPKTDRSNDHEQNETGKASKDPSDRLDNSFRSKSLSDQSSETKRTLGSAVLGLDDPEVKEVFDEYLEQYLKTWQDNQKNDDMSKFLDHLSTTTEVFCEESGLTEDVQEQIIQRLEKAHEDWIAMDVALETGEIDQREYLERNGSIEKEVMTEMTEMIGEEAWEKLAQRIWDF